MSEFDTNKPPSAHQEIGMRLDVKGVIVDEDDNLVGLRGMHPAPGVGAHMNLEGDKYVVTEVEVVGIRWVCYLEKEDIDGHDDK